MRKEDYYTISRIMDIIKNYHINIANIKEYYDELKLGYKSVGVAQYGIEATMPKGNNVNNPLENEVIRQIEKNKFYASLLTDMKYLQNRWHRIDDEKEAMILNLRLEGYKVSEICKLVKMERSNVYRVLERIAHKIKSCPQENATNGTNYHDRKHLVYN